MQLYKSRIVRLCLVLIVSLLFLTFFSNTIHSFGLPGVIVGLPTDGIITNTSRSAGYVDFIENISLFAEEGGRIVLIVMEGEHVSYGDLLFSIHADIDYLYDRLEVERSRLMRTSLSLVQAEDDLAFEENRLSGLRLEHFRPTIVHMPDISWLEYEGRRLELEIVRAETDYENQLLLYAEGIIPSASVADTHHRLNQLIESKEHNMRERERILYEYERAVLQAEEDNLLSIEQRTTAYERERHAIQQRITGLRHSIALMQIDEIDINRTYNRLQLQIAENGISNVYADVDGFVRELGAGLQSGMHVERNRFILRLSPTGGFTYITTAIFSGRIDTDDTHFRVNVPTLNVFRGIGFVRRTSIYGGRLRVEIAFDTTAPIMGGERTEIIAEQFSERYSHILPNSAIRLDAMYGHYLLYVAQERRSMRGFNYVARQVRITVLNEGNRYTSFDLAGELQGPVIINSDRPIADGSQVRMVGEQ